MPHPIISVAFFFCMIGFKLKVQRFRQGELFEIVMMRGICHLVIDLDDVLQGYEPIFQGGREREGWRERKKEKEREREFERQRGFTCVDTVHKFKHNVCASVLATLFVCGVHTHTADDTS